MRYDVLIEIEQKHSFAIEAENPNEAQERALSALGEHNAESQTLHISVEAGP